MTAGNSLINLGDLSQPVTVLIEKISDAIGVVYEPTKIRRNAKAEADANRTIILADLDLQSEIANRGLQRLVTQQTRKQINIESIIQQSIEELPDETEVEQLDEDWLANFFDKCENISNETMQILWSRLLTSEATKSGSISKKTINLISNLDKEDAELFTNFCQFVWFSGIDVIPMIFNVNENHILAEQNIFFQTLSHLESIGLIKCSAMETFALKNKREKRIFTYFDQEIEFNFENEQDNTLYIGACFLTFSGIELFRICEAKKNVEYLKHIIDHYKLKGIVLTDVTVPARRLG